MLIRCFTSDQDKLANSVTTEQGKTLKGAKGDVLRGVG